MVMSRALRFMLLAALALGPLVLLGLVSVGDRWFAPALLPSAWSTGAWTALLRGPSRLGTAFGTSLLLATATGVVAAALGLLIARGLARAPTVWRHLGSAAAFLPVLLPPIALATALQYAVLRLQLGGTTLGVLLAHAVPATGYATVYLLGVCLAFDTRIEDEARTLGAGPFALFRRVTLPLFRRPLLEAFALGWLISWAQVPLTLLVGGGAVRSLTVETFAYVQAGQDRFAAAGALLLVGPALLVLGLAQRAARTADEADTLPVLS